MEDMKKLKIINKDKLYKIVGFIVFIGIAFNIFCKITYLFRGIGYDRNHMVGIKNNDYDMIYIGGSAAFVYWQPLKAWHDKGFTSYLYATNSIQVENIQAYLEEARKYQNPDLFVVGVRAFQYYSDDLTEAGIRNGADGMDITSLARYKMLNRYFENRTEKDNIDKLSYYLDIAKYHTNTENLGSQTAWQFINNDGISQNMGWVWKDEYGYVDTPRNFETNERAKLIENNERTLRELLDYCKKEGLNVLFVVCPYYITQEDQAKYNTIEDIVESYGFRFLNTNNYYNEMGIDFATDFYNKNHVNLFGAEKYTDFLENYIVNNYTLPNHHGNPEYAFWDAEYQKFEKQFVVHSEKVANLRSDVEKGNEIERQLVSTNNIAEWYSLANDKRYKILIANASSLGEVTNVLHEKILDDLSIDKNRENQICIIQDEQVVYVNTDDNALSYEGTAGIWNDHIYNLSVDDGVAIIKIDGEQIISSSGGICIALYDNNYRRVADCIVIYEKNGNICIYRK